ncbi:MAG: transposase [Piscirickettsiaceae bacterium]|nr:MAG: transposase [Piscirickettsiaceae bacterium]
MKLGKLPSRTPVKLTISFLPEIYEMLEDYGRIYEKEYGENEKIEELVPYMIEAFLKTDHSFRKARKVLE